MQIQLLIAAVKAAYQAGCKILEIYDNDFTVAHKADDSPLTQADTASHQIIRDGLKPLGFPLLSEEGKSIPFAQRSQWSSYWLIDPLDGTKEFIKRNGEFTVNIAFMEHNAPVMGVIYVPVQDRLYFASKGQGAFRIEDFEKKYVNDFGPDPEEFSAEKMSRLFLEAAVQLPDKRADKKRFTIIGSRSHVTRDLELHVERMQTLHGEVDFISAGSSLKFCRVAEGAADQYPRLGPTMEWDTAAGQAIAECAGAQVRIYEQGLPLAYNKESLLNPWFIVERI